jgi:isopentenyl-diphosphate delta-isomerase
VKSKIYVVDDQDQIIGVKNRAEIDYKTDIYRVTALWLTNSRDEVLIVQRAFTKSKDPGLWGPAVAGTVDEGESYDDNIKKETEEEIGLTDLTFKEGPKARICEPHNYFCQWYTAVTEQQLHELMLEKDEVHTAKWVSEAELKRSVTSEPEKYLKNFSKTVALFC